MSWLWVLGLAVAGLGLAIALGPREPVEMPPPFDATLIGDDPAAYFAAEEAGIADIVPGTEKRIVWAGAPGARTALSVVYLHGFSATSEEVRPVPDDVARALGANLVYTRLTGHGRTAEAMAEPAARDWIADADEAIAVARAVGERVLVVSNSTGGTLATIAALDPGMSRDLAGIVFLSPNYGINHPAAPIIAAPWTRYWGPLVFGAELGFDPLNDDHALYWTERYPSVSVLPLVALARHARRLDHSAATVPALFVFSDHDEVVSPRLTRRVAEAWGGPTSVVTLGPDPRIERYNHVLAGRILSPGMSGTVTGHILDWARGL